jgi:hypothetical protein
MGESWQAIVPQAIPTNDELYIPDPRSLRSRSSLKRSDEGDVREFEVTPGTGSVLILSQKYPRDWRAQALADGVWRPARTVAINGVFQGVLLPPDAQRVRLEFRPFARYAFIAHVFWLFLFSLLVVRGWRSRLGRPGRRLGDRTNRVPFDGPSTDKDLDLCLASAHLKGIGDSLPS